MHLKDCVTFKKNVFLEVLFILIQETYGNENSLQPKSDTFRCMHRFTLDYYTILLQPSFLGTMRRKHVAV